MLPITLFIEDIDVVISAMNLTIPKINLTTAQCPDGDQ